MKIQNLLKKNGILIDISGNKKDEVLRLMATFLANRYDLPEGETIADKIIERENDMTTGIGYGIAIPHARIVGIDRLYMIAGRSCTGIEFNSIDDLPVHLFFMMLSPKNTSAEHTVILSNISRIMSYEEVRSKLLEVKTSEQFYDVIVKSENKYVVE